MDKFTKYALWYRCVRRRVMNYTNIWACTSSRQFGFGGLVATVIEQLEQHFFGGRRSVVFGRGAFTVRRGPARRRGHIVQQVAGGRRGPERNVAVHGGHPELGLPVRVHRRGVQLLPVEQQLMQTFRVRRTVRGFVIEHGLQALQPFREALQFCAQEVGRHGRGGPKAGEQVRNVRSAPVAVTRHVGRRQMRCGGGGLLRRRAYYGRCGGCGVSNLRFLAGRFANSHLWPGSSLRRSGSRLLRPAVCAGGDLPTSLVSGRFDVYTSTSIR